MKSPINIAYINIAYMYRQYNKSEISRNAVFIHEMTVPKDAIDGNGHVNNVSFVQWMQDVAVRHFEGAGCMDAMHRAGCTWVVRSHKIQYMSPAFAGETLHVRTWIVDFGRARSMRRYKFLRAADGKLLVRGETDWVFVNAKSGRPTAIPEEISRAFALTDQDIEDSSKTKF